MSTKPRIVPQRNEFYLGLAFWMAAKSKDPHTQMGSVIISADNRPCGWGYNGPPAFVDDDKMDWSRPAKYPWLDHAEENAIEHSNESLVGATIYVTAKPCWRCMKKIAKARIKQVIYYPFKPTDPNSMFSSPEDFVLTDQIARDAKIPLIEYQGKLTWMKDKIYTMEAMGLFG